jgi:hypothetical protein
MILTLCAWYKSRKCLSRPPRLVLPIFLRTISVQCPLRSPLKKTLFTLIPNGPAFEPGLRKWYVVRTVRTTTYYEGV